MTRTVRTALVAIGGIGILLLLALVGLVAFPGLVGGDATYIVTSDSMSPTIESGDVIITAATPPDEIESGDVVTFQADSEDDGGYVTHRVVDVVEEGGERYFETQGDANDEPDAGLVPAEYAQGTLHLHVPYLGYLLLFARSSLGLLVLVIGPGLVLVASGSLQLLREFGYVSDDGLSALEDGTEPPALETADGDGSESAAHGETPPETADTEDP